MTASIIASFAKPETSYKRLSTNTYVHGHLYKPKMATSETLKTKKKYQTKKSKNAMAIQKVLPTTTKTPTIRA